MVIFITVISMQASAYNETPPQYTTPAVPYIASPTQGTILIGNATLLLEVGIICTGICNSTEEYYSCDCGFATYRVVKAEISQVFVLVDGEFVSNLTNSSIYYTTTLTFGNAPNVDLVQGARELTIVARQDLYVWETSHGCPVCDIGGSWVLKQSNYETAIFLSLIVDPLGESIGLTTVRTIFFWVAIGVIAVISTLVVIHVFKTYREAKFRIKCEEYGSQMRELEGCDKILEGK